MNASSPRKPTVSPDDLQSDPCDDVIGKMLLELREHTRWTKEKYGSLDTLTESLRTGSRIEFWSTYDKYVLARVGESAIYNVPRNKRGNLSRYRGKTIRLICIGSGSHFDRKYIVKPYPTVQTAGK